MLTPKRPRATLESTKSKLSKFSSSSAATAKSSVLAQGSAACFIPSPSAAVMSMPVIVVFSVLTAIGYWRQVSHVSEAAKSLVDIRTVEPGSCPSPPMLPTSVPSHMKGFVEQASRAAKMAWLIESNRSNYTGGEISDEQLNKTYRQGRKWFARHTTTPEVGMSCPAYLPLRIYSHTHLDYLLLALQMRINVNASQKRSFDEQIGRGRTLPFTLPSGLSPAHITESYLKLRRGQAARRGGHVPSGC